MRRYGSSGAMLLFGALVVSCTAASTVIGESDATGIEADGSGSSSDVGGAGGDAATDAAPDDTVADDAGRDAETPGDTNGRDVGEADIENDAGDDAGEDAVEPDAVEDAADADPEELCGAVVCADDQVCVREACRDVVGSCLEGPCEGDSFCCGDSCVDETMCVSFVDGDVQPECSGLVEIGIFEAGIQCEWSGPPDGDPYPNHRNVLSTPMVANLPHPSGYGAEIVFTAYNHTDGGNESGWGSNPAYFGVIRIVDGDQCGQLETIHDPANPIIAGAPLAIGDLDNDGIPEIVAQRAISGMIAFKWNFDLQVYERFWVSSGSTITSVGRWDGPSIHDLDNDGLPEVISGGEVYDGTTGARLNPGQSIGGAMTISVIADVDADGLPEYLAGPVYGWNTDTNQWVQEHVGAPVGRHYAPGDFGTDGPGGFDRNTRDGIAEIVAVIGDRALIATLDGDVVLDTTGNTGGGPPTIGDFDNDGRAEFASAGGTAYRVFDPDCTAAGDGCAARHIRWSRPSQDLSSRVTGSSIFDFDADGQAEAIYADECFTRIYDGATGSVLWSAFRTSCTWYENPVLADTDFDGNSEIVVGSNANCSVSCPAIDPIHPGIRCEADSSCPIGSTCGDGLCRCMTTADCGDGMVCTAALAGTPGTGQVCRASHPPGVGLQGVRVLRDSLDRWASSRPVWNQHAFSVTNVLDNLTIPRTSEWLAAFALDGTNTFRANEQGSVESTAIPDATARLAVDAACTLVPDGYLLRAEVCNRGWRPIGTGLPSTFRDGEGTVLCTALTTSPIRMGECAPIECGGAGDAPPSISLRVNDDGSGRGTTLECVDENNAASGTIACR